MANAWCINAYDCNGCLIQTLQNLDSACIGVGVQYTAPNPLDDKRLDYIKYTDKCWCVQCLSAENEILIYATNGVIKNLTLTNDDVNEAIKIKWNDIFWSNRAKTIVRYKTWSYPTSITDGTLAVEETTKNQYSSIPFSLSGVLDETTYYISAFAVDSNGTIIDMQSMNITTDFMWTPWIDTMLYIPMNTDFSDHSQNLVSISNTNVQLNTSILSWKWVWYFYSNSHLNFTLDTMKHDFTISFFMKSTETLWYNVTRVFYSMWWTTLAVWRWWTSSKLNFSDQKTNEVTANNMTVFDKQRHFVTVVYTYSNQMLYLYSDAILRASWTSVPYTNTATQQAIWYFVYSPTSDYYFRWYASELIVEKKWRTQEELTKYFNKMKSIYWIS